MHKSDYYKLCEEVWKHNRHYYVENAPIISDFEFDALYANVVAIEKEHPEWIFPGSPTQKVGEMPSGTFQVVPHKVPMLSIANTYSPDELEKFIKRVEKLSGKESIPFAIELKIDGIAVSLRYEEGFFVQAVTRGNGEEGEDITQNVLTIRSLPFSLPKNGPKHLEIRGEIYMSHSAFLELNVAKEGRGEAPFANPRNAAGGSLKLLDASETAKRKLDILIHGIAEEPVPGVSTHFKAIDFLSKLGFPVIPERALCHSFDEILAFIEKIEKKREHFPFDIDGCVIKVDDLQLQKKLGATGNHYRWACAYKFSAKRAETRLLDISVQVGRTGVLTPVAELEPVFLAGSTISRATLHNEEEVKRKDVRVNDFVIIEKGGDVIPKVVAVNFDKRNESSPWEMPDTCPACGTPVVRIIGEVAVRCPNKGGCPSQGLKRLIFFASKHGMDIEHLGEKIVAQLVEKGFVTRISDIYTLKAEELSQLKNFKEKAIHNLLTSIEKSKEVPLSRFLMALGIKHVGEETALLLAKRAGTIERLEAMTEEEFCEIEGIGPVVASALVTFFAEAENRAEIERLKELGVHPIEKEITINTSHPFFGKTFVLSGALENYTREKAASLIRERGGKVSSSVSRETDYLLVGSEAGSKLEKAKKLGVALLDEKGFIALL